MEKLITQLRILKEMNLKPNYSALAREYGCDRRTVKKYNEGYSGGEKTRNKKSKLDKYYEIIKEKLQYKGIHIKRHIIKFMMKPCNRTIHIIIKLCKLIYIVPNSLIGSMENMCTILVNGNAIHNFGINIPTDMIPFF